MIKNIIYIIFTYVSLFHIPYSYAQNRSFCAYDNAGSQYELNLIEGQGTLTYKKYTSSRILLQTLYGTWNMVDEGVYGQAYKVVASINNSIVKWIVVHDDVGKIQQLQDESAGRVWSFCNLIKDKYDGSISSINEVGSNYSWNKVPTSRDNMIRIGNQIWMTDNLNVDTFQNGDKIMMASSPFEWKKCLQEKIPAWCYYNNDSTNAEKYGKLYNWYGVSDSRNLAPKGWRIPTSNDWEELTDKYLGSNGSIYARPGYLMKSREGWAKSDKVKGDLGNTTGFSANPAGFRTNTGDYLYENYCTIFWMSTKHRNFNEWHRFFRYDSDNVITITDFGHDVGLSVRCIASEKSEDQNQIKIHKLNDELEGGKIAYIDASGKHGLIWTQKLYGEKKRVFEYNYSRNLVTLDDSSITYDFAVKYCSGLGNGWRLPNIEELNKLYSNRISIGLMWLTEKGYQSFDEHVWAFDTEIWTSEGKSEKYNVVFHLPSAKRSIVTPKSIYGTEFRFFAVKSF
jgi:uncharacterized protein (TIGR02145 family)